MRRRLLGLLALGAGVALMLQLSRGPVRHETANRADRALAAHAAADSPETESRAALAGADPPASGPLRLADVAGAAPPPVPVERLPFVWLPLAWVAGAMTSRAVPDAPVSVPAVAPDLSAAQTPALAVLELLVNGESNGDAFVILDGTAVWIDRDALTRAAIPYDATGPTRVAAGRVFVPASSLGPRAQVTVDPRAVTLAIRLAPGPGVGTVIDLASRPAGIEFRRDGSVFVNYGFNLRGRDRYDLSTETGVSIRGALLLSAISWSAERGLSRGPLSLTVDDRGRMIRWVVGDSFVPPSTFGGGVPLAGVALVRNFSLDPYFVRYPSIGLTGSVDSVSTLDVYANDQLVSRREVLPGRFDVQNVPVPMGRGSTRVVVRDAFGRQRELVSPYFLSTSLLAPGLHEFAYVAGVRRRQVASRPWAYDTPVVFGRHRAGLSGRLTLGFFAEASPSLVDAGLAMTRALRAGELEVEAAVSGGEPGAGAAGAVGYVYRGPRVDAGAQLRGASPGFASLASEEVLERQTYTAAAFAAFQAGRLGTVTLSRTRTAYASLPAEHRSYAALSAPVRGGVLSVSAGHSRTRGTAGPDVFAAYTLQVGERTMATASQSVGRTSTAATLALQRMMPVGTGYGYRLQAVQSSARQAGGSFQYQGAHGRYEVSQDVIDGRTARLLSVSGGLVGIGGGLFTSRPVAESFALVQVPGVAGVRTYVANQEVGRTNGRGSVLVPNLLAYYGNRVSIDEGDVPIDHAIGRTDAMVAPPYRGGARVVFVTRRGTGVTGLLVIERSDQDIVPAYGDFVVRGPDGDIRSPIGRNGAFYLEALPQGVHPGTIEYRGDECRLLVTVPPTTAPVVDVGRLRCTVATS